MKEFPLDIVNGKKERITVKSTDEVVELIYKEYQNRIKLKGKNHPKLIDTFWFFGIDDNTILAADYRTLDILNKYEFLKYSPQSINNQVWMDCVVTLNRIQPKMF